jgi:hypothetical protein
VFVTDLQNRPNIIAPLAPIEIQRQEPASLIQKHRVNTHDKWTPSPVTPQEMPTDDLVRYRKQLAVLAGSTFDPGFLT